jgi:hypothetical protein
MTSSWTWRKQCKSINITLQYNTKYHNTELNNTMKYNRGVCSTPYVIILTIKTSASKQWWSVILLLSQLFSSDTFNIVKGTQLKNKSTQKLCFGFKKCTVNTVAKCFAVKLSRYWTLKKQSVTGHIMVMMHNALYDTLLLESPASWKHDCWHAKLLGTVSTVD